MSSNVLFCVPVLKDNGSRFLVTMSDLRKIKLVEVEKLSGGYSEKEIHVDVARDHLELYKSTVEKLKQMLALLDEC